MGQEDYPLSEFALRLANAEEKYAKEILSLVECFYNSRLDLPAKKLEEIGKCHLKTCRQLKKSVDNKKTDYVNLWKICNIFSTASVGTDNAMREIRGSIRKRMKKNGTYPIKTEWSVRRFMDEYRPGKNIVASQDGPMEVYDVYKPRAILDKFPKIDIFKGDKKEKRISQGYYPPIPSTNPPCQIATIASERCPPPRPSSLYSSCSSSASSEEQKSYSAGTEAPKVAMKPIFQNYTTLPIPAAPEPENWKKSKEDDDEELVKVILPQNMTMNWITTKPNANDSSIIHNDDPIRYCESFYSKDKNVILVSDDAPRVQTRIQIGDDLNTTSSNNGILAQTHSIQITQDTNPLEQLTEK